MKADRKTLMEIDCSVSLTKIAWRCFVKHEALYGLPQEFYKNKKTSINALIILDKKNMPG